MSGFLRVGMLNFGEKKMCGSENRKLSTVFDNLNLYIYIFIF